MILGTATLALWLLIKGVNPPQWDTMPTAKPVHSNGPTTRN
jgi:hypothetical protein